MTKTRPTGVKADKTKKIVTITWDDGHVSEYPFAGLRAVCPCAECKGGHENMGTPADIDVVRNFINPSLTLNDVGAVGSYALEFLWSDGHNAGIYTWTYLREACPCEICHPMDNE